MKKNLGINTYVIKFLYRCRKAAIERKKAAGHVEDTRIFRGELLASPVNESPRFFNHIGAFAARELDTVDDLEEDTKIKRIVGTYLMKKATAEVRQFIPKTWIQKHAVEIGGILYSKNRILEGMEFKMTSGFEDIQLDPLQINVKAPIFDRFSPLAYMIAAYVHRLGMSLGIEE